jgi:hypothetical protein
MDTKSTSIQNVLHFPDGLVKYVHGVELRDGYNRIGDYMTKPMPLYQLIRLGSPEFYQCSDSSHVELVVHHWTARLASNQDYP